MSAQNALVFTCDRCGKLSETVIGRGIPEGWSTRFKSLTETFHFCHQCRRAIYPASKTRHAPMWRELRQKGWHITGSWIDEAGAGETLDYAELSSRCISEIKKADVVVLYCERDDHLRGALIEAGAALCFGLEVWSVGACSSLSPVFANHPNWKQFATIEEALT